MMQPCPICRRDVQWKDNVFSPFCSERCQVVDLGAWASGDYAVAGNEEDPVSFLEDETEP
jgi:endogenous inhibitor of DNA gyrase (YacG/DUF329 family)